MKNTCSLCGGKLKDGICTECGMNNQKSDEMYRDRLNRSKYDHTSMESMSHVHTEQGVKQYRRPALNENRTTGTTKTENPRQKAGTAPKNGARAWTFTQQVGSRRYQSTDFKNIKNLSSASGGRKSKPSKTIVLVAVMILVIILAMAGLSVFSSVRENMGGGGTVVSYNYDYNNIQEALPATGEHWDNQLPAGMYMVGIDMPEGEYTVTGPEGSSFEVHDNTHSIYRREAFGTEEYEIEQAEGIPLFTGALVCVDGMNPVSFVSENAQTQDLENRTPNPVTETVEVNGTMTAGTDFPAGTYDIEAAGEDFGYITYEVPYEDPYSEGEQSYYSFGVMMEKNPTSEYPAYCSVYKNVVLPEGAVVDTEGYLCRLVPSNGIVSEDYDGFYNNLY